MSRNAFGGMTDGYDQMWLDAAEQIETANQAVAAGGGVVYPATGTGPTVGQLIAPTTPTPSSPTGYTPLPSGPQPSKPVNALDKNRVAGYLRTQEDDQLWEISGYSIDEFLVLVPDSYDEDNGKRLPVWDVDRGGAVFYERAAQKGSVNDCVYKAIDSFRAHMGLGEFTSSDKAAFSGHELVESGGVGKGQVLTVAQFLLWPWGLGISEVFVPIGAITTEEMVVFRQALGTNPFALGDAATTDDEAIKLLKEYSMPDEKVAELAASWRFHYVTTPLPPVVIMYNYAQAAKPTVSYQAGKQVVAPATGYAGTQYGFGHAEFLGPRDKLPNGNWAIAFRIGRIEQIKYAAAEGMASITAQKPGQTYKELSLWQSKVHGQSANERRTKGTPWPPQKQVVPATHYVSQGGVITAHGTGAVVTPHKKHKKGKKGQEVGTTSYNGAHIPGSLPPVASYYTDFTFSSFAPSSVRCPLCGSTMVYATINDESIIACDDCIYSTYEFAPSKLMTCTKHPEETVYFRFRDAWENEQSTVQEYVCVGHYTAWKATDPIALAKKEDAFLLEAYLAGEKSSLYGGTPLEDLEPKVPSGGGAIT